MSSSDSPGTNTEISYLRETVAIEVLQETTPSNFTPAGTRSGVAPVARRLLANEVVNLPPEATGYLANIVANPEALAAQVDPRSGYLNSYSTAGGTLRTIRADVYLGAALPLFNPRIGDQSLLRRPTPGSLFDDDKVTAVQNYQMTLAEFEEHLRDTIARVAAAGGQYAESILATGVSEPGLCEVASIHLTDINMRFTALVLRDGGTRCVQSILARLGVSKTNSARAADFALERIFGDTLPNSSMIDSLEPDQDGVYDITQSVKKNIGRAIRADEAALSAAIAENDTQKQVSIQQTMILPEEIIVGWEPKVPHGSALEPAISARVRSRHVNVTPWVKAAQNADVIDTVVTQLIAEGLIDEKFEYLLDADTSDDCAKALAAFGYSGPTASAPLWRAAVILREFTTPGLLRETKRVIRSLTGKGQIRRTHLAGYLAPLIDAPWRKVKRENASQSSNAWARGGALIEEMIDSSWSVVFPSDINELPGVNDRDSRLTLAAIGGVALVADRFLTTVAIAGVASGGAIKTPYRVPQISDIVELLATPENIEGQRQLAAAAIAFSHDALCATPWSPKERITHAERAASARAAGKVGPSWYSLENVVTGAPLTLSALMEIADFDGSRSDIGNSNGGDEGPAPAPTPVSAEHEAINLRGDLLEQIQQTGQAVRGVEEFTARLTGHRVLSISDVEDVTDAISGWLGVLVGMKRALRDQEASVSAEDQEIDIESLDD